MSRVNGRPFNTVRARGREDIDSSRGELHNVGRKVENIPRKGEQGPFMDRVSFADGQYLLLTFLSLVPPS